ncbi:hypothetical protein ACJMK2_022501 [Sinanodonta woodiana]|uniref:Uncharacterized protein n=1 Tax=Sinanodonta woodiana TaxID=1069815 RepID=A0ABD3TKA0_SINWO
MTSGLILTSVFLIASSCYIYKTSGDATINNIPCRDNHRCERHPDNYTWCYTDSRNNWDYCCDTPCQYDDKNALLCKSGTFDKFCGSPGMTTALRKNCVDWKPCGHYEYPYYWCYTDNSKNWDYCCHPNAKCFDHGRYTGIECNIGMIRNKSSYWAPCKPIN